MADTENSVQDPLAEESPETAAQDDNPTEQPPPQGQEGEETVDTEDKSNMMDVAGELNVKALKEFREKDTSEVPEEESRPSSGQRPASGERPASGRPASGRPASGERPASGRPASGERPASGRPASGRPASGERPASGRPASGQRASSRDGSFQEQPEAEEDPQGADRPSSATRPASAQRPGSATSVMKSRTPDRPPSSGRPGSAHRPGSSQSPGSAKRPGSAQRPSSAQRPPSSRRSPSAEQPAADPRPLSASVDRPGSAARLGSATRSASSTRQSPMASERAGQDQYDEDTGGYSRDITGSREGGDDRHRNTELTLVESDPEEEEEDDVGGDSEESDDENEMVVLDPDHPLMRRFQTALNDHLTKQRTKVSLELRELSEALRTKRQEREELGVNLYGLQQELARLQMFLENQHDELSQMARQRQQCEEQLQEVRGMYKDTQTNVTQQRKDGSSLQTEVENLALHLFYMTNAKVDIRGDIAVMRRAAEKADSEVNLAETDKQKQDLYVDRLTENVDKLREQISLYEAQCYAQSDETEAAKEALSEACLEIESINLERKQLYQQWNSSIIGMRRRDEAHAAMQEALSQQRQQILSLQTEIDGYRKSILKEQENNETLTILLNKNEGDMNMVKKLITLCQSKQEQIKQDYSTYTRMLHETEQALNRATTDRTMRMNEVNSLRKQIEREFLEKMRLEETIMETMQQKMTMDKVTQYAYKMANKTRKLIAEQEASRAKVENEISRDTLDLSHTLTRVEHLRKDMEQLDREIHEKNEIISRSENEIIKRNGVIERKQGQIDQYNKKIEAIISSQGGEELGPLEQEVNGLNKNIDARVQDIAELQQFWLRQQSELVKLTQEKDGQQTEVNTMKKALMILHQKKLRIENEIITQQAEHKDVERSIRNMQNDMLKLNLLLNKEGMTRENMKQDNILIENDFILSLREAEREAIQMQNDLEGLGEEKERLLNSLVEAERQIMLWEKKTQLAREAKATVDSEVGQGEIRAMTAEIHRMEVRHTQLMKLQEKLIQDMEKAVYRRDTIVTRGDAQSKLYKKVETKGTFQKKLTEMRKKIKQTQQDANACDQDLLELRNHQQILSQELEDKQTTFQQLQGNADTLDGDLDRLVEVKQKHLADLLAKQQKVKYYQALKDGKYTLLCKTEAALDTEMQKQTDRMHTIATIIDRIDQEFPHVQPAMRKVMVMLSSRGVGEEEQ